MFFPYPALDAEAFAFETITVTGGALPFTVTKAFIADTMPAERAVVTVETAPVRFTLDGTVPTSTVGHLLNPGDVLVVQAETNLRNFRVIVVSANATLQVTYYRG